MSVTDEENPPSELPRHAFRFSLLALFLFVTAVCIVLAWWVQPRKSMAEALFHVAPHRPVLLGDAAPMNPGDAEIFRQTQIAYIKSPFVLQAALRQPGIASLPLFAAIEDDVAWLTDHLEIEMREDSELMAIRLRGREAQANDLARVVDAVCRAYQDEVVFAEDQRSLIIRDVVARSAQKLRSEIERTMRAQKEELAESGGDEVGAKITQFEIEVMVSIWRELVTELERRDVNTQAPSRVRQMQAATIRSE